MIASNERMAALIAECDSEGIDEEVQTFRVTYEATIAFINNNTDNPQVVEELIDFPDRVNVQVERSAEMSDPGRQLLLLGFRKHLQFVVD